MAGSSTIGALRVDLGLNSAQFTTGLKKAETGLAAFGRAASVGLAAVATAAAAASVALGVAVKHAIDHADALSKSAQKAGVTVEALSRLEYAAKLSDVSLEGLTGGLNKLNKSMADAAGNSKGPAATAFKALGISVTDASGKLRSSSSVIGDIADRFAKLPDGAAKSALAIRIFGKAGAELIPLLNSGADGLARMARESDNVGATISTKTARAAEEFNDTLTRIGAILEGVTNKVMEAALPALQNLADTLADPAFANAAAFFGTTLVGALNLVANSFENCFNWASSFLNVLKKIPVLGVNTGVNLGGFQIGPGLTAPNSSGSPDDRGGGPANITVRGGKTEDLSASSFAGPSKKVKDFRALVRDTTDTVGDLRDTTVQAFTSMADAIARGVSPLQAIADELGDIGKMLLNAGIKALITAAFGGVVLPQGLGIAGGALGHNAGGTNNWRGGPTWVGERGPEIVNLPRGSSVTPNDKAMGGPQVHISISGSKNDAAEIARAVGKAIPDAIKNYNRNPYRR